MTNQQPADWQDSASCSGMGRSWDALTTPEQISLCRTCPVRTDCLTLGRAIDASGTVFGGRYFPEHTRRSIVREGLVPA